METRIFARLLLLILLLFFVLWYFRSRTTPREVGAPRVRLRGEAYDYLNLGSMLRDQKRREKRRLQNWEFGTGDGHVYITKPIRPGTALGRNPYVGTCHSYCEDDPRCVAARYRDPGVCDLYDHLTTFKRSNLKPPCVGWPCIGKPDDYRDGVWLLKMRRRSA